MPRGSRAHDPGALVGGKGDLIVLKGGHAGAAFHGWGFGWVWPVKLLRFVHEFVLEDIGHKPVVKACAVHPANFFRISFGGIQAPDDGKLLVRMVPDFGV